MPYATEKYKLLIKVMLLNVILKSDKNKTKRFVAILLLGAVALWLVRLPPD